MHIDLAKIYRFTIMWVSQIIRAHNMTWIFLGEISILFMDLMLVADNRCMTKMLHETFQKYLSK